MADRKHLHKITAIVLVLLLLICIWGGVLCWNRLDGIYYHVKEFQQSIQDDTDYNYRNDIPTDYVNSTKIIEEDETAWYSAYNIIAHSGGGLDGKTYLNCAEAWEYEYAQGTRVYDADLAFTSDGHLVLRHEWYDDLEQDKIGEDSIPSYEEFMNTPICYKYSPMDCDMMIEFMNLNDDVYVACDVKDGETESFEYLVERAYEMELDSVLDRIIVSFYDYDDYNAIHNVYDFSNWAIRQYENSPHNYYELCEFCLENSIPVVMVKEVYLKAGDDISVLTEHGITVLCAVVNSLSSMKEYGKLGVSGFVSDFIYEDDMQYIETDSL